MNNLIVECSEPGWVITLSEDLEHLLRHVTFERAQEIAAKLKDLCHDMGPAHETVWRGFRIEVPNECGSRPLSFSTREEADKTVLEELVNRADQKGIGKFDLWHTNLMDQGDPHPETREQYVSDLADSITSEGLTSSVEEDIIGRTDQLPDTMSNFRKKMMSEYAETIFAWRAKEPEIGHRWVEDTAKKLRDMLEEINTRSEAVMEYELDRLDPGEMKFRELIRWVALSVRLGRNHEKWMKAGDDSCSYLFQKAALIHKLWNACHGFGPARSLMENRMKELIGQAKEIYTPEGVDALRKVRKQMLHDRRWPFSRDDNDNKEDENSQDD